MDSFQQTFSTTPNGEYIKTFIGEKTKYPIDVYYDDVGGGYFFYGEPAGIYQEIYNNVILSKPLIDDCETEIKNLDTLNETEQSILNGINEAIEYAKRENNG